jgi:transcriptional regulator with XRE-family HTH domain
MSTAQHTHRCAKVLRICFEETVAARALGVHGLILSEKRAGFIYHALGLPLSPTLYLEQVGAGQSIAVHRFEWCIRMLVISHAILPLSNRILRDIRLVVNLRCRNGWAEPLSRIPYTAKGTVMLLFIGIQSDTILGMATIPYENMHIGRTLRRARLLAGLSLRELAMRAHTSHATLLAYEQAKKSPSAATFLRILSAAGFAVDFELSRRIRQFDGLDRGSELEQVLALAGEFPAAHQARCEFPVLKNLLK